MDISLNKDSNKYINFLLLIPIALSLMLSLRNIGSNSLWLDEAWSVTFANLSWGKLWDVVSRKELNMVLYYYILKIWVMFFGDSEFAVRFLSVVFSICAIGMTYFIGARLFDIKTGLTAAILLAVNAFFIEYSQEARGYTLYIFLATASAYYFVDILRDPRLKNCTFYVITSTLMVYNHFFGLLILLSHAISGYFLLQEKTNLKKILLCMGSIAILIAPAILFILFRDSGGLGWVNKSSFIDLKILLYTLTGDPGNGKLLLLYFVPCFLSLDISVQRLLEYKMTRYFWRYAFLLCWFLIPIVSAYIISLVKPVFIFRYLITSLTPLVLLVAIGLSTIRNKLLYLLVICGIIYLSVGTVFDNYSKQKDDWRSATQYVINNAIKGDGIILYGYSVKLPFEYYYRKNHVQEDILDCIYPSRFGIDTFSRPSWIFDNNLLNSIYERHERIWCVLWHDIIPGIGWDSRPMINKIEEKYIIKNIKVYDKRFKIILYEKRI